MEPYRYIPGSIPVVVSIPHAGTHVPQDILERFVGRAKQLPDTDWHVDRLYHFARALGVHMLIATYSRYVVDLNRPPNNEPLYPGQFTTCLCPVTFFDGTPLYHKGEAPGDHEITQRLSVYWQPYHDKLRSLVDTLSQEGRKKVAVFDAHSIRSQVPALFEGMLPDLNLGTGDGATADDALVDRLVECCRHSPYSHVLNGRFKGGYITRHYGKPGHNVHAVQLELAQHNYMQEDPPYTYDDIKATALQATLTRLIAVLAEWSRA